MKKKSPILHSHRAPNTTRSKSSSPNYFKTAAKRLAGLLRTYLLRRRKSSSVPKPAASDDVSFNTNPSRGKGVSFSTDDGRRTDVSTETNSSCSSKLTNYSDGSLSGVIGRGNFSFEEIRKATQNFSLVNKIGEGSFGVVYKGTLKDGSLVAIKRAKKNTHDEYLALEFKNEILTLSKIEHLNLVKLYGFMEHKEDQIIVVEYVSNGTLREHLDGTRGNGLEVADRLDIAIDVAHAVTYLHMYADHPIIHRDIKSSNILITNKLRAKVADFGFARMAGEDGATHVSTQVKGTSGYLDPEYLRTSQLTEKSDVYSFGVLLVELVTGRYPIETRRTDRERVTIRWAIQLLKSGESVIAMDPRLTRGPAANRAVEEVLKLAQQCLAFSRQSRPSMQKCAEVLWRIRKKFRQRSLPSPSPSITIPHSPSVSESEPEHSRHTSFG